MKVYVPLSPARSEHVYQPESPAHRKCYEPVSPRRKLSAFDKILKDSNFLYGGIINNFFSFKKPRFSRNLGFGIEREHGPCRCRLLG